MLVDLDKLAAKLCTGEFSGLTITFNDHKMVYESAADLIGSDPQNAEDFISTNEKLRALELNQVWELQWYPRTPIGFSKIMASTFGALINHLEKEDRASDDVQDLPLAGPSSIFVSDQERTIMTELVQSTIVAELDRQKAACNEKIAVEEVAAAVVALMIGGATVEAGL